MVQENGISDSISITEVVCILFHVKAESISSHPILDKLGSLAWVKQPVKGKENP